VKGTFISTILQSDKGTINEIDSANMLIPIGADRHIVVLGKGSTSFLEPSRQIILNVRDIEVVRRRVIEMGGKLLEECIMLGKPMHVVEGPENIQLLLVGGNCFDLSSVEALLAWQIGRTRANDVGPEDNAVQRTEWDPPRGAVIPTLFPSVLHMGAFFGIYPNSSAPVPFETDLFKGTLLVAIRTTPMDQTYRHMFEGVRTCFEVQVQGKFKIIPSGPLFIGM
jgi:hypothetical protein